MTALEFYTSIDGERFLLAGEGLFLKIYRLSDTTLLGECQVFRSQTIHGVTARSSPQVDRWTQHDLSVVLWGGRSYTVLTDFHVQSIIARTTSNLVPNEFFGPDWILDVAITGIADSSNCMLVTAHGSALSLNHAYDPTTDASSASLRLEIAPSQAAYYSAHALWDGPDLLLALGSVFGDIEIIIGSSGVTKHLCTLVGHEGSIFGVQLSSVLALPDGTRTRLVASCSDDRTIRVWDLALVGLNQAPVLTTSHNGPQIKETGFGQNDGGLNANNQLVAMAMGHASRIWKVKFVIDNDCRDRPLQVNVLSFGEDTTCQRWSLDHWLPHYQTANVAASRATLTNVAKFDYHSGKHLWAAALSSTVNGTATVATGGADSKISTYDIGAGLSQHKDAAPQTEVDSSSRTQVWTPAQVLQEIPGPIVDEVAIVEPEPRVAVPETVFEASSSETTDQTKKKKKAKKPVKVAEDIFSRYAFVSKDRVMAVTGFGKVLIGNMNGHCSWEQIAMPKNKSMDLRSYCVATGIRTLGLAFMVGVSGTIYCYNEARGAFEVGQIPCAGKVTNLLCVTGHQSSPLQLLATLLGSETAFLLTFEINQSDVILAGIEELGLPAKSVITSAQIIADRLVLGARSGIIYLYDTKSVDLEHLSIAPHADDKDEAVTSIVEFTKSEDKTYFLATNRGGTYSIFHMMTKRRPSHDASVSKLVIDRVHRASPPLSSIESAWLEGTTLFLSGFRSKAFVVYNETEQLEVLNIDCGGSHRNYAYLPSSDKSARGAGTFVCTKASSLHLYTQKRPSHTRLKAGGHGREIKACAMLPGQNIFATGSEDTMIRLWRYSSYSPVETGQISHHNTSNFKCLAILEKHTAGIQALQFGERDPGRPSHLFSSSGFEEFYVWTINEVPSIELGVVLEASLPAQLISEDRDLRIMAFDTRLVPQILEPCTETVYEIILVYSDSTMKLLHYSTTTGFSLISQTRYTSACLTQVKLSTSHILTASTDGHTAIWSINRNSSAPGTTTIELQSRSHRHQNAILSLDVTLGFAENKPYYLITGGDDNSICISSHLPPASNVLSRKHNIITIPNAHSAAITGIGFLSPSRATSKQYLQFWTASIDQILKKWTMNISGKEGKMVVRDMGNDGTGRQAWEKRFSTADCSGLVAFSEGDDDRERVMIFGAGMEVFSYKADC